MYIAADYIALVQTEILDRSYLYLPTAYNKPEYLTINKKK